MPFYFWTEVSAGGQAQLEHLYKGLLIRLRDLTPAWHAILDDLDTVEAKWFDTEGGGSWRPLSPRYAAWKAKHYPGRPLLVREGFLRDALTNRGGRFRTEAIREHDARVSVHLPYAGEHQRGTATLPARPVIGINDQDRQRWVRLIRRFVMAEKGA